MVLVKHTVPKNQIIIKSFEVVKNVSNKLQYRRCINKFNKVSFLACKNYIPPRSCYCLLSFQ